MKPSDLLEDVAVGAAAVASYSALSEAPHWPLVAGVAGLIAAVATAVSHTLAGQGH